MTVKMKAFWGMTNRFEKMNSDQLDIVLQCSGQVRIITQINKNANLILRGCKSNCDHLKTFNASKISIEIPNQNHSQPTLPTYTPTLTHDTTSSRAGSSRTEGTVSSVTSFLRLVNSSTLMSQVFTSVRRLMRRLMRRLIQRYRSTN